MLVKEMATVNARAIYQGLVIFLQSRRLYILVSQLYLVHIELGNHKME